MWSLFNISWSLEQETQKPSNWTDGSSLNRNELEKGRHLFYRSNITSVRCWTLDQKQKTPWRFPDWSNHRPQSQLHIYPICTLLLCHMYLQINFWLPPSVASDCRLNWQANIQLHLSSSTWLPVFQTSLQKSGSHVHPALIYFLPTASSFFTLFSIISPQISSSADSAILVLSNY